MPRKKAEPVTRIFYLDSPKGSVEVTVKGPAGAVHLQSTHDSLSISTGLAGATAAGVRAAASTPIAATVQPADAPIQPTNFVSSSKLSESDIDAELKALKDRGASIEEVQKVLDDRNVAGAGPKPRHNRGAEIAKNAAKLRTIVAETPDGMVEETIGLSGGASN